MEFNLSEHETYPFNHNEVTYPKSYVKEFIRLLKKEISLWETQDLKLKLAVESSMNYIIDKLAGDKLCN